MARIVKIVAFTIATTIILIGAALGGYNQLIGSSPLGRSSIGQSHATADRIARGEQRDACVSSSALFTIHRRVVAC